VFGRNPESASHLMPSLHRPRNGFEGEGAHYAGPRPITDGGRESHWVEGVRGEAPLKLK